MDGSDDFYAEYGAGKWADWQAGAVVSYVPSDYLSLSLEYLHAEGLDDDDSGDRVTLQAALVL